MPSPNETTAVAGPPLSACKKRATVRRVFGDILESVKDADFSLCYSTSAEGSPSRTERSSMATETDSVTIQIGDNVAGVKPFASILGMGEVDKENAVLNKNTAKPIEAGENVDKGLGNDRQELLRRLRQQAQTSSQRSATAKKAQEAVNKATKSVHQTLDEVRNGWNKLEEFKNIHAETEHNRRELLKLQKEISSSFRKSEAEKQKVARRTKLESIEKESQFKSEVFRDHKKALRDARLRQRRESIKARAKLRENHRQGERKLQLQRIEEDQAFFEERQLSFAAGQEEKKRIAQSRRKSYQFRNGDARRIREIHAEMEAKMLKEERESYELKRKGEKDAEEYQRKLAQERRESLAARNTEGKRQKDWDDKQKMDQLVKEHESYELERAAAKDAENFKRELEKQRRESLAARNKECVQHAKVMDELNALAREQETESLMLKWAGESDAKDYLAKLAKQRRDSLKQRNQVSKTHRDFDAADRQSMLEKAHAEAALQSACQKDVEKYRKECADQRRASLEFRGKEACIQRLEEEQRKQRQREIDDANRELEDQARQDVMEYFKECKQRRRLSLAFRAKERRRHIEWEQRHAAMLLEQRSLETEGRGLDICHIERARQHERVHMVMDALRHAGCQFDDSMFAHLLK